MKKRKDLLSDVFNNNSMHLFTMLCGYFLLLLVLYSIFQIIKLVNLNFIYITSTIIPIIMYLIVCKEKKNRTKIIVLSIYSFIVFILPFFYNITFDLTDDGNAYHKTSIAFIKNGWNPLYETVEEFQNNHKGLIASEKEDNNDLWMEHYPKATWMIAATIYSYTGNVESGKCITLILNIMLMIITYNCLARILDRKWTTIITLLVALNPIVLVQALTYYVDGILGILFAIELLLLILWNPKEKINIPLWICISSIAAMMVNIKFTGLLCSGVVAACYYFYWLIKERKNDFKKVFKKATIPFVITYLIAILLVGSNSYVKNTLDHKNPLFPLIGEDKVDIITNMQPKSFEKKTKLEKFMISLFSKSENTTHNMEPSIKFPLKLSKTELEITKIPDARMGGFGPLFAMVMILCMVTLLIGLWKIIKNRKDKMFYYILPILAIIISMILVGESWWARYIPQLYFLPILSLILNMNVKENYKNLILFKGLTILLTIMIFLNSSIFFYGMYHSLKESRSISRDINELKTIPDLKLRTTAKSMYGYYYTLNDNHVNYEIENDIDDTNGSYRYCSRIMIKNN